MTALEFRLLQVISSKEVQVSNKLYKGLRDNYAKTYYRNIYNIQNDKGIVGGDFAKINQRKMKKIVRQNWQGSNFSDRLWGEATKVLPIMLKEALTRGATLGYGVDKLTKQVKMIMKNYSETNLHRLINT